MFFAQVPTDFWGILLQNVERIGIPAGLTIALLYIGYKMMNRTLANNNSDRKELIKLLADSEKTKSNHISHLEVAVNNNISKIENVGDRIVEAIHGQTELIREMLKKKE